MVRATSAPASRRRRKRVLKRAKGFWGDRKNHIRQAKNAVMRALASHTRDRKLKKREFRSLWVTRLSVGAKVHGLSYSKMMCGLKRAGCLLNRKMLSEMAIHDPEGFRQVIEMAKRTLVV